MTADNARFAAGKAQVSISAFGCELTCDSTQTSAGVTLRTKK